LGRLRVLSGREVCRILESEGFAAVRQRRSHILRLYRSGSSTPTVPEPVHAELKTGTLASIIRQSRVPRALRNIDLRAADRLHTPHPCDCYTALPSMKGSRRNGLLLHARGLVPWHAPYRLGFRVMGEHSHANWRRSMTHRRRKSAIRRVWRRLRVAFCVQFVAPTSYLAWHATCVLIRSPALSGDEERQGCG